MNAAESLCARFRKRFSGEPRVFRAPGRVNLIGEHTDYNGGFVMPAAIGLSCFIAASTRADRKLLLHSENLDETREADFSAGAPRRVGHWSDYPVGVAAMLEQAGMRVAGANLLIHSEVPLGGGVSSSAALEVATACALIALRGHRVVRAHVARLCQQAEHEYAGVRCGIMDQFVALHGAEEHALLLDCRSLDFVLLPLPPGVRLVICNTMVKHEMTGGEYNKRRADCEEGVRLLSAFLPGIQTLRDVTIEQLEQHRDALPERVYRRARHVVTENARTEDAASALREGDLDRFGHRMKESHASLRDDYEVSCAELDRMVEIANRQPGVHGARMTGGGFGGCTISLVDAERAENAARQIAAEYEKATGRQAQTFVCTAAAAASEVATGAPQI